MEGSSCHCVIRAGDGALFRWGGPAYELPAREWRGCSQAQRGAVCRAKHCPQAP
jgi:hypothetical protein